MLIPLTTKSVWFLICPTVYKTVTHKHSNGQSDQQPENCLCQSVPNPPELCVTQNTMENSTVICWCVKNTPNATPVVLIGVFVLCADTRFYKGKCFYIYHILDCIHPPSSLLFLPTLLPQSAACYTDTCYSIYMRSKIHKWKKMWYLPSCVWFICLIDLRFHPSPCKQHNFILLYGWLRLHCVYIPHFLYLLICWWAPRVIL